MINHRTCHLGNGDMENSDLFCSIGEIITEEIQNKPFYLTF